MSLVDVATFRGNRWKSESRCRNKVRPLGRNLKLTIEYDGTNYAGWQRQNPKSKIQNPKIKTIQETIENTLQKILQESTRLIVSGRTDAGVHAVGQVANFKTNSKINLQRLQRSLNALLPDDISISKVAEVPLNFHSRFDVKSKVYRYTILNRTRRSAFLKDRVYFYPYPLDVKLMQRQAKVLLGRHNFKSFQAADKLQRNPVRTIKKLRITQDKDLIYIDIEADGFLYNMVRSIVGTLIEIGRGRFSKDRLKKILLSKDRRLVGPTVSACGLCLLKVNYK